MNVQDAVLYGLMLMGPDCWYAHGTRLDPEMFDGERRQIFDAIARLNRAGQVSESVLVAEQCDEETGALALEIASTGSASRGSMKSLVEHVRASYQTKRARDIGAALMESGDIDSAKSELLALEAAEVDTVVDHDAAKARLMDDLAARSERDCNGIKTGLTDLDRYLQGIEPGDLCVIAARPRMGKTALMVNIAERSGAACLIFSLEMSTAQLMTRLVAMHGVDYGRLRRPRTLEDADWQRVTRITSTPRRLWINDTGGLPIGRLEAEAYRMVKARGVELICIDYLQLVTCKAESRFQEVSEVSRRLKALAKNLRVPVIALAQVSREAEKHGAGKLSLAHLKESGQIEQDADQVIFVNRPEVYAEGVKPGLADIYVEKNRGGETGKTTVAWQGKFQRFVDYAENRYPRAAEA